MKTPMQSQPQMNSNGPIPHLTNEHNNHDAQSPVRPQVAEATQTTNDTSLLPILPASSSGIANKHAHSCISNNGPPRPVLLPGTTHMEDLPATRLKTHPSSAHASSATVYHYPASPSTTESQIPPLVVHDHATPTLENQTLPFGDTHTRPHEREGGLSIQLTLNPQDGCSDPWSPEYAHTFPSSMRRANLEECLDHWESQLDIPKKIIYM